MDGHDPSWSWMLCCAGGGGGGAPTYRSLDGKPPPPQFQTDEFVTYAGLTLPKPKKDLDYWYARAIGAAFW